MSDTTHKAPDLLPCPFCGGKPYLANVEMAGCAYVVCTDCRMQSDDGSQQRVVTAWNTRNADLVQQDDDDFYPATAGDDPIWIGSVEYITRKRSDDLVQVAVAAALREADQAIQSVAANCTTEDGHVAIVAAVEKVRSLIPEVAKKYPRR